MLSSMINLMAAKAVAFLESAIQREKERYLGVIDRPKSNQIKVLWSKLMFDSEDSILELFSLLLSKKNRTVHLEQSSNIVFYGKGKKRTIMIELSSSKALDVTSGSHVSMDNLIGLSYDFWPSKPTIKVASHGLMSSVTYTPSPEPIDEVVAHSHVKKRTVKPFSDLKDRQKRNRLGEYRQGVNNVMSMNNLSDTDQSEMLQHFSNEKKSKRTNPPVIKLKPIDVKLN